MNNTWDSSFWVQIIQFGILMTALLAANTIRRKVGFVKRSLLPSAVVGGLLIFALKFIPAFEAIVSVDFMEILAYHCLALGFIALALKPKDPNAAVGDTTTIIKTGGITVGGFLIQGIFGMAITVALSFVLTDILPASGILLTMGFGQGPGQALNFGMVYENTYGFVGGASLGLSIATIGFLVACIVGVIYLNILKRQNKVVRDESESKEYETAQAVNNPNDIPLSESVDKLTVQIALVIGTYFLVFLFMQGITLAIDNGLLGSFGVDTIKPLIWGFNFLFGVIFGVLVKKIIEKLRAKKIMKRDYPNSFLLNRIAGFVFDLMILAGVAAIEFDKIAELWLPLLLLCATGTVVTFVYINFVCKRVYPDYRYEATVALFGQLTGTASTGIILLREIDPLFKTPMANNLVMQNIPALLFGFPMLLLAGFAPRGLTETLITLGICIVLFLAMNSYVLLYKPKSKAAKVAQTKE